MAIKKQKKVGGTASKASKPAVKTTSKKPAVKTKPKKTAGVKKPKSASVKKTTAPKVKAKAAAAPKKKVVTAKAPVKAKTKSPAAKAAKKTTVKKVLTKKAPVKKATVKKVPEKKVITKKAPAKKAAMPAAKKVPAASTPAAKTGNHFSQKDLDNFRVVLLAMRDRITGQSDAMRTAALQRNDEINPEEDGTDAFIRLQTLTQVGTQHQIVAKINEALRSIEESTYGICDMCGALISKPRLKVLPFAKNCIHCQSKIEQKRYKVGRR